MWFVFHFSLFSLVSVQYSYKNIKILHLHEESIMANPRAIQLSAMDQLILQRRFDNERKV